MNELVDLCVRSAKDRQMRDHRECVGMMLTVLRQLPRSEVVEFAIAEAERQFECPDDNAWRLWTRLTHEGG